MLTWEEIVQNYIACHSDKIQKVCQPLREHFGIEYFSYHRIDAQGKYIVLVDRPEWAEYYVSEKFFLTDPYLRHPNVYQTGMNLLETHGSPEYQEKISQAKRTMSVDFGAVFVEKQADAVEFFGFSAHRATSSLAEVCVNRPSFLKAFACHFKRELKPILLQMDEASPSLLELKGNDFYTPDSIDPPIASVAHHSYLREIGLSHEVDLAARLSVRERQCLRLLLAGEGAKGTALHLGLSHRTIEAYLENIRAKLRCSSKDFLLLITQKLSDLGLI